MTKKIRKRIWSEEDAALGQRIQELFEKSDGPLTEEDREIGWVALEGGLVLSVQSQFEVGRIVARLRRDNEDKTRMEYIRNLAHLPIVDFEDLIEMQRYFESFGGESDGSGTVVIS